MALNTRIYRTGLFLFLLAAAVTLLFIMTAHGGLGEHTLHVDDDAPGGGDGSQSNPYNNIQEAVENAQEGDTVMVSQGSYQENILIYTSLILVGKAGTTPSSRETGCTTPCG